MKLVLCKCAAYAELQDMLSEKACRTWTCSLQGLRVGEATQLVVIDD